MKFVQQSKAHLIYAHALRSVAALALCCMVFAPPVAAARGGVTRIIVPYAAGGPVDLTTRILAEAMKDELGPIIVEDRPGAAANIGMTAVAQAKPDGRTLGVASTPTHGVNMWLYSHLPFDPNKDFTPISQMLRVPNVLVMKKETADKLHINTVADLIAYGKAHPGKLNFGSGGNGSGGHLAGALFNARTGIKAQHIPFNGSHPAETALLGGQTDFSFDNLATAAANIQAGLLKPIAVTTLQRSHFLPDVPPVADTLPGFEIYTWWGLVGPAGLSPDEVKKINAAAVHALGSPTVKSKFALLFAETVPSTPSEFAAFMKSEQLKYKEIVKLSGAHAN
ncbi:Bug family tripartite tricarboxylate transporter substrate binding protein [Candidimonas nitroreducens]